MPGLLGIAPTLNNATSMLQEAASIIAYNTDDHVIFSPAKNARSAGGVFLKNQEKQYCFAENNKGEIWLDGKIYPCGESDAYTAAQILAFFQNETLPSVLNQADGQFAAVIYDFENNELVLFNDRLGLRHLFYALQNEQFCWASEQKAFYTLLNKDLSLDQKAIKCYLQNGQLLGDLSWFENTKLLSAASILRYSLTYKKLHSIKRYWNWSEIKKEKIGFRAAEKKLATSLKKAVHRAENLSHKKVIPLSGGLDSRAIVAAIENPNNCNTLTFGVPGNDERKIAAEVSAIKGIAHTELDLNTKNWLSSRFKGVWRIDGQINFIHLHISPQMPLIANLGNLALSGFVGDLVAGGSWLKKANKKISKKAAAAYFGASISEYVDLDDAFYNFPSSDPFALDTRARRFTNVGIIEGNKFFEHALPFVDRDLLYCLYQMNENYRLKSKIYRKMLLHNFPSFFKTIPWQKTGITIDKYPSDYQLFKQKIMRRLGLEKKASTSGYANYDEWMREPESAANIKNLLFAKDTFIKKLGLDQECRKIWGQQLDGKNHAELLGRYISLEVWLSQLFTGKYLSNEGAA